MEELKNVKTKKEIKELANKYSIQLNKNTKKELKQRMKELKTKQTTVLLRKHCIFNNEQILKGDDGLYYDLNGNINIKYIIQLHKN